MTSWLKNAKPDLPDDPISYVKLSYLQKKNMEMAFYAAEWGFLNHDVSGPKLDGFIGAYMKKKDLIRPCSTLCFLPWD